MRKFLIYILFFYIVSYSNSQTRNISKLYNHNGCLLADTTLRISENQLKKWEKIEDTLTKRILSRLYYPQMLLESYVKGQLIISFTVDSSGQFNNFCIERFKSFSFNNKFDYDIKMFAETSIGSIIFFSGDFSKFGFISDNNKLDKYYIPFYFSINANETVRKIIYSFLTFDCEEYKIKLK